MSQFAQGLSLDGLPHAHSAPLHDFAYGRPHDSKNIHQPAVTPLFSIDPRHASKLKNTRKFSIHFASARRFFAHPPGNEPETNSAKIGAALGKNRMFLPSSFPRKFFSENRALVSTANPADKTQVAGRDSVARIPLLASECLPWFFWAIERRPLDEKSTFANGQHRVHGVGKTRRWSGLSGESQTSASISDDCNVPRPEFWARKEATGQGFEP
ncbi:MAG: hypothetical protein IT427_11525 [Pirellulales bacterium]|nr:hypothetical protein [Pirellulales bacterium]